MAAEILANPCGSGKTWITLLLIYFQRLELVKDPNAEHRVTFIIVPSTVVDVWYNDRLQGFRGH